MTSPEELSKDYFTEEEIAAFMGYKSIQSFRVAVSEGKSHPPFKKIGRLKRFPKKEFKAWESKVPLKTAV